MTHGNTILSDEDVKDIKHTLWMGWGTHVDIATKYFISASYVSWVRTGKARGDVPWPDGSIGGMPQYRKDQIRRSRYLGAEGLNPPVTPEQRRVSKDIAETADKVAQILDDQREDRLRETMGLAPIKRDYGPDYDPTLSEQEPEAAEDSDLGTAECFDEDTDEELDQGGFVTPTGSG